MTREEAITKYIVPAIEKTWNDKRCKEILEALEQEPCKDAISRQAVLDYIDHMPSELTADGRRMIRRRALEEYISDTLPSVKPQQPKTGNCKDCKHFRKLPYHAGAIGKCVNHWGFCPPSDWYCADFEPQESEE